MAKSAAGKWKSWQLDLVLNLADKLTKHSGCLHGSGCRTLACAACAAQSPCHSVQTRLFRECSLHLGKSSSFSQKT